MRSWRSRSRSISAIANWLADGKALGLGQRRAILEDRGLAVPGEVGGRFAGAGRRVQIGGDAAGGLRAAQQPARLGLADRDVACRKIGENGGAGERGLGTRRHGDPDVLADLGMHDEAGHVVGGEQQVGAERRGVGADGDLAADHSVAHDKMPRLVEFAVVGQMHLRHHAEQPAAMDGDRRVVERAGMAQRGADQQQRQQIGGGGNDRADCCLDRVQQGGLLQQIADRVAGYAEFREHRERRTALVALALRLQGSPRRSPPGRRACTASCRRRRGRSRGGRSSGTQGPCDAACRLCHAGNMVHRGWRRHPRRGSGRKS